MEPKQIVYDFLANRMQFKEFKQYCQEHPEVLDWVQSVVPADIKGYITIEDEAVKIRLEELKNERPSDPMELITLLQKRYKQIEAPYDIRDALSFACKNVDEIGQWLNVHAELRRVLTKAFPDEEIEISDYIHKLFNFVIDACPEYIGGPEIDAANVFLDIYNRLPPGTETARKKEFKSQIKALFRCKGIKKPRWIQEPEWPMGVGSPMRFISQSNKQDVFKYVFEDVDTGELRTIIQLA